MFMYLMYLLRNKTLELELDLVSRNGITQPQWLKSQENFENIASDFVVRNVTSDGPVFLVVLGL